MLKSMGSITSLHHKSRLRQGSRKPGQGRDRCYVEGISNCDQDYSMVKSLTTFNSAVK